MNKEFPEEQFLWVCGVIGGDCGWIVDVRGVCDTLILWLLSIFHVIGVLVLAPEDSKLAMYVVVVLASDVALTVYMDLSPWCKIEKITKFQIYFISF